MVPHSTSLQYYSVTSKNIPCKPRCKKGEPTYQLIQGAFHLQGSCTKHRFLSLCLISDAVQVIQSPDHDGRFLHKNADSLSCFCCLSLHLFSLSELDMSSQQLACRCFPMWSALSYTFPNPITPFQFKAFHMHLESFCQYNQLTHMAFHIEEDTRSV